MEVGVSLGTGLSARLNVVEEPKPGPNFATTLLQNTVVQIVKEMILSMHRRVLPGLFRYDSSAAYFDHIE